MKKITIIIPTAGINAEKALITCVNSVIATISTQEVKFVKLLIVANGIKDENTKNYLNDIIVSENRIKVKPIDIEVLWHDEPLGYIGAINTGLFHEFEKNCPDFFLFLNDDCKLFSRDWISLMYEKFEENEKLGIVGVLSLKCPVTGISFPLGFCEMIRSEILKKTNGLDVNLGIGYGDDTILAIESIKMGYEIFSFVTDDGKGNRVGGFPINHDPENTMHSNILFSIGTWNQQTAKNRKYLAEKYWPVIHVIMPTYGRYVKLQKALDSVDKQTFRKLKIHVCSDGHDEKVKTIVEKMNDKYVNYDWIHPEYFYSYCENEGVCGGLPRKTILDSLPNNENEWCVFVDSDNEINPDYCIKLWQSIFTKENEFRVVIAKIYHDNLKKEIPENWDGSVHWGNVDSLNFMVKLNLAKKFSDKWIQRKINSIEESQLPTGLRPVGLSSDAQRKS